jgi:P4 family phage/plasmid primase-like protien
VLGLGADLLPVVPDPTVKPSPLSKVKAFGKIPSEYNAAGEAHGIAGWQSREITWQDIERWKADRRLSMCVRTSAVRAIDVDITDEALAANIASFLFSFGDTWDRFPPLPKRSRANSSKFLLAFRLDGDYSKRIIKCGEAGRIEFLANGQQFVAAGSHPSGASYEWAGGLPSDIPTLKCDAFEELWAALDTKYGEGVVSKRGADESGVRNNQDGSANDAVNSNDLLTTIDDASLGKLREALSFAPLLEAAGDNDTWSEVGYGLLSLGSLGAELWLGFSEEAHGFERGAPEAWWDAHISGTTRTDYRHIFTMARDLGWAPEVTPEAFPVSEPILDSRIPNTSAPLIGESALPVEVEVPLANSLCSDQANANRLNAQFGNKLRVVGGSFYCYNGTHWERGEGQAARYAAQLSAIVKGEADAARIKADSLLKDQHETTKAAIGQAHNSKAYREVSATESGAELLDAIEKADALEKWVKACDMRTNQTNALELLRKLLTVDAAQLDAHHHLLNCLNGTIDLRTGILQEHNPDDYITHCAPVAYVPAARAPAFEAFLEEILDSERAGFLRRWFGYCVTGETREQKIVLHIGDGANGKGTLFRVLQSTLGSYMHTAAPHLLTAAGGERHPTEIADLFGRRLVVSHESDEGASLREGFLKHASGEDRMSGRFMFKDFFEFTPTFKIQLLTNHKPQVKGAEFGIWRRLLLVWYPHKYGTQEQIDNGTATRLADDTLTERLLGEREGVLAWLVAGAREWYNTKLRPPKSVVEASQAYRGEQDRVAQFIAERCIVDPKAWVAFSGGNGLYPAYTSWCKESGYMAMGVNRFASEVTRVIPTARREENRRKVGNSWRTQNGVRGLHVNTDYDGGGVTFNANEDLL